MQDDSLIQSLDQAEQQAYELILGDAGKVFDLAQEKTKCATATAATRLDNPAWRRGGWWSAVFRTSPSLSRLDTHRRISR